MKLTSRPLAVLAHVCIALPAAAHEAHGLAASHWHATDVFGCLLVGTLAAVALWLSRGGR